MAINFPDSPTNGQTHAVGSFTWQYDGEKWVAANGIALDGLSDVTAPTPTSGDFLKWNGTAWVNDAIDLGTDTTGNYIATISGTANQISVTGSGSESAAVTIGLPSDVTIANDLTVTGNLTVNGTTTTLNTETLSVEDNIVILNSGVTGSPTTNAGVEVERGTSTNVLVRWNETNDKWEFTNDGTTYGNIAALGTIALGTDTTGNYVSDISSGTGISVTHTPSEGSTGTVAIDTAVVPQLASANTFTTNQIISGSTSTDLLRITQTGAGNALLVEDSTNPDSTPFVIDATGIVVAGHTSSLVVSGTQKAMVQAHSTVANRDLSAIASVNWNSTTSSSGAQFTMSRSRSGTVGTSGAIITGDQMGRVAFVGDDGSAWAYSSAIIGLSEGTISTGVIPGVLLFQTANSAGTMTERMRIDSAGVVILGSTTAVAAVSGVTPSLQVLGATAASSAMTLNRYSADTNGPSVYLGKSRNATVGSHTVATSGDRLGNVYFSGSDGTNFVLAANISAESDAAASSGIVPGRLLFFTSSTGGVATERMRIDSAGRFGMGVTAVAGRSINLGLSMTNSTQPNGIFNSGAIQSDATSGAIYYNSWSNTAANAGAIPTVIHYQAVQGSIGASSSMGTQIGFVANSTLTGASSNWGFQGDIAVGTNRYNLYMSGTAANYMLGRLGVGAALTSGAMAQVTNTTAGDTGFVVKGAASQTGDLVVVQNSANTKLWHINSSNSIGHGVTTATTTGFIADAGLVAKTSTAFGPQYVLGNKTNDANAGYVIIEKDRAGAIVASGDFLGNIQFRGYDGANYRPAAMISGAVDSAPGIDDMPGRLTFLTAADGSFTLTERMRIDSSGNVGIGGTPLAGRNFVVAKSLTGSTSSIGVVVNGTVASDVTADAVSFRSSLNTSAASFAVTNLIHFDAPGVTTPGSGSTITNQIGFRITSAFTGATNNYGFFSDIAAATGRWNLHMGGTAANYLAGRLGVGAALTSGAMAQVTNTTAADKAFVVKGAASQTGNLFEIQNSAGTLLSRIDASGTIFDIGSNVNTDSVALQLGNGRSGNGYSYIDLVGDATYTDYGLRVLRGNTGANAISQILHRGTGDFQFVLQEAAALYFSTTNTERMRIDSNGQVGIGTIPAAGRNFVLGKAVTGSASSFAMIFNGIVQSDVTTEAVIFRSSPSTAASSFVIPQFYHYQALGTTIGATSSITHQYGYFISSTFTGATNNYGFYGDIASGTNRWNFYANGTAANYMAGRLGIGATNTTGSMVQIVNTTAADDVLTIKGAASQTGFLTEWMNSANSVVATMSVAGAFTAVTKSFVIDHPTKNGKKLRYASLEGPENGVYVRGKSSGVIELPDYWAGLVDEDSITVQVTPIGKPKMLFVENISISNVVIGGSDETEFFYFVQAERKDVEKLVVEYDSQL